MPWADVQMHLRRSFSKDQFFEWIQAKYPGATVGRSEVGNAEFRSMTSGRYEYRVYLEDHRRARVEVRPGTQLSAMLFDLAAQVTLATAPFFEGKSRERVARTAEVDFMTDEDQHAGVRGTTAGFWRSLREGGGLKAIFDISAGAGAFLLAWAATGDAASSSLPGIFSSAAMAAWFACAAFRDRGNPFRYHVEWQ